MNKLGNYGRLGNQMFQYAALIGLAKQYGLKIAIPNVNCQLTDTFSLLPNTPYTFGISFEKTVREKQFSFDETVFKEARAASVLFTNINIEGYFQTDKYWRHAQSEVREAFSFKNRENEEWAHHYTKVLRDKELPLVFVGVRRGDYLNLGDYHPFSTEYYTQAINRIRDKYGACTYVVVTDDVPWCKSYFPNTFIDYGDFVFPAESYATEMAIMKYCDHAVIANSTFHWWGAWLNTNPAKTIIAPQTWFGPRGPQDWQDIYCDGWIKC